jgi:ABC-type phosphate transport system auxiliary subunit
MSIPEKVRAYLQLEQDLEHANAAVKQIKKQLDQAQFDLIDLIDHSGLDAITLDKKRFAVDEKVFPQTKDWDQVYDYIYANKSAYILERRLGVKAYRELVDLGETIPGTEPFTKRTLSVITLR